MPSLTFEGSPVMGAYGLLELAAVLAAVLSELAATLLPELAAALLAAALLLAGALVAELAGALAELAAALVAGALLLVVPEPELLFELQPASTTAAAAMPAMSRTVRAGRTLISFTFSTPIPGDSRDRARSGARWWIGCTLPAATGLGESPAASVTESCHNHGARPASVTEGDQPVARTGRLAAGPSPGSAPRRAVRVSQRSDA